MSQINPTLPKLIILRVNMEAVMFSNAVKLFSLNGFDIKIDPSWLIIATLVTWSLWREYFPIVLPGASGSIHFAMALTGMLGLFASLLLHELSHSVVARHFGVPIKSITLFIFGGIAELEAEPKSARIEFWVALAGPVMSLCLALGFWILAAVTGVFSSATPLAEVLSYLALINLVLALFNLVPAFPLDGGRVLRAYLWHRSGDMLAATRAASRSGEIFGYALIALGILALLQGGLMVGIWQLMIGWFVLLAARSSYTFQLARVAFEGKSVEKLMTRKPITASPDMTLSEFVNLIVLRYGISFVPVVEGRVLLGHVDQSILSGIDRDNWGNTKVGDIFVGLDQNAMVAPELAVPDLLELIKKTGRRKFMVVEDHTLLGVITLADLSRYLNAGDITRHLNPRAARS